MKLTQDNMHALLKPLRQLERNSDIRKLDIEAVTANAEASLKALGFKQRGELDPQSREVFVSRYQSFWLFWHKSGRYYWRWLEYQDHTRDWYINAEIKLARGKINSTMSELKAHLLDLVEAGGKLYDI
jgi:hypothetical protein